MPDQADNLRQMLHAAPPAERVFISGPPMVLVTGGRSEVGVTTVAVNLAAVLADEGPRVLIVDAAGESSNLAEIAGARRSVEHTISDVIAGRCSVAEALTPGPAGTMLLAAKRRPRRRRGGDTPKDALASPRSDFSRHDQHRLLAEIQSLEQQFDLLVVDLGSEMTQWTRRFWLQAQLVLMVTTTDSSALLGSYAMIKSSVADQFGPQIRLVVNCCEDERHASRAERRLSESCRQFLGLAVPAVPALPRHVNDEHAVLLPRVWEAPDTSFGHAMLWLGRAIGDVLSSVAQNFGAQAA